MNNYKCTNTTSYDKLIQYSAQKKVHPANEYLHDEKGQYLCAVNSLGGGFLNFLP